MTLIYGAVQQENELLIVFSKRTAESFAKHQKRAISL
jgi:hypothetical protein